VPFTPAHVAAVLPLRHGRARVLPFAALAAGSMSPDLPYFLPNLSSLGAWTHTALGVLTVDVVLGLALWGLWRSVERPLHDLSPKPVRARWSPARRASPWWAVPLALAVGAASHVGWDEFTHPGRFGATHLAFLAVSYPSPLGPLPGYQYAQYASSALGLLVIAWVAARHPVVEPPAQPASGLARALPWLAAAAGLLGAVSRVVIAGGLGIGGRAVVFAMLTGGIAAAAATVAVACWAHALASRARALQPE
jgi:hypothetical protein